MPGQSVRRASKASSPKKRRANPALSRVRGAPKYVHEMMYAIVQSAIRTFRKEGPQELIIDKMFWSYDNANNWLHGMKRGFFRTILEERPTIIVKINGSERVYCDLGAKLMGKVDTSKLADGRQFWYIVLTGLAE